MRLEQGPDSPSSQLKQPALSYSPIGLEIIGKESKDFFTPAQTKLAKEAYLQLFNKALDAVKKNPINARRNQVEWTVDDVLRAFKEISNAVYSQFHYGPTWFLTDAFIEKTETKVMFIPLPTAPLFPIPLVVRTKNKFIDCDTSTYVFADVFTCLGFDCHVRVTDNHAFLRVDIPRDNCPVWLETTRKIGANESPHGFYMDWSIDRYDIEQSSKIYHEMKFSPDIPIVHLIRAQRFLEQKNVFRANSNFQSALAELDEAVKIDPGFYNAYELRAYVKDLLGDHAGAEQDREKMSSCLRDECLKPIKPPRF